MGLRRQISAIVAAALIAATVVLVWQSARPTVYASTSLLAIEASPATVATAGGRPENIVFLARTYAARARTRPVVADAIRRSDLSEDIATVLARSTVEVSNTDATITVTGTGATARAARELTVALTAALARDIRRDQQALREARVDPLDTRIAQIERSFARVPEASPKRFALQQEYQGLITARAEATLRPPDRAQVLSPPTLATAPVSPQPVRAGLLAALIAVVIGAEAVVAVRMLRNRHRTAGSVEPTAPLPTG